MSKNEQQMIDDIQHILDDLKTTRNLIFQDLSHVDIIIKMLEDGLELAKNGDINKAAEHFANSDCNLPTLSVLDDIDEVETAVDIIWAAALRDNWEV